MGGSDQLLAVVVHPALREMLQVRIHLSKVERINQLERVAERTAIPLVGDRNVIKVTGHELFAQDHAVTQLFRENFVAGFQGDSRAADRVNRVRDRRERWGGREGDFPDVIALGKEDRDQAFLDRNGRGPEAVFCIALERVAPVEEALVAGSRDKKIDIRAVAVRPPGSQRRPAAQPQMVLATQVFANGVADCFEEFGRAGGQVVFSHQTEIRSTMLRLTDPLRRS